MNRDERDDRPPALPPALFSRFGVRALAPIDSKAGGTWIAANQHGITFTLMNRTDQPGIPTPASTQSRGLIIPSLAHHETLHAARDAAQAQDWSHFPPCRLTIFGAADNLVLAARLAWNGVQLSTQTDAIDTLCLASSGLGDALVQSRVPLYHQLIRADDSAFPAEVQARFHQHRWPDTPETSVLMSRPAHRTVSITTVDVGLEEVVMTYSDVQRAIDALEVGPCVVARLARLPPRSA